MFECSDISEVVDIVKASKPSIIAIDGLPNDGKSYLASRIAEELKWTHINLDDYLEKHQGNYANYIYTEIIIEIVNKRTLPLIIEGLCLLDIFQNLQIKYDILIYVKEVSLDGVWIKKDEYLSDRDMEKFIIKKKVEYIKNSKNGSYFDNESSQDNCIYPEAREEIIRYHYKYKPHMKADILFSWVEIA